jgi:glycosyltransferase involved in cell wall biosynthesis
MTPDTPKVSVVIPCYNQGRFVDEAVASVLAQTYRHFEIVVVNDGSTDEQTTALLDAYDRPKTRVIHTPNQGLAAARNAGIAAAAGAYILPLDADDKIDDTYMEKAVRVLEADESVGIVYCEAHFFGEKSGRWELPDYSLDRLLLENMIFCAGFFRKADWAAAGGYNTNMVHGWEDYDFWLSLIELGRGVHRIPEPLFYYRMRADSMVNSLSREQYVYLASQLFRNHDALYKENIQHLFSHVFKLGEENGRLGTELELLRVERERLLHVLARRLYAFTERRPRLEAQSRRLAHMLRRVYRQLTQGPPK